MRGESTTAWVKEGFRFALKMDWTMPAKAEAIATSEKQCHRPQVGLGLLNNGDA
jgi:hypothetical protein